MAATDAKSSVAAIGFLISPARSLYLYGNPCKKLPFQSYKKRSSYSRRRRKQMAITVTKKDNRYATLKKGHNVRWPASEADAVSRMERCELPQDAAEALQRIVSAGLRPTVRSGGHCYEDFVVNNPDGAILDLSLLTQTNPPGTGAPFRIGTGTQLWNGYCDLYKRHGVTLPGGTCSSVAAGGHISGGGYGLLSRLHGLTADWLTPVDILTVDAHGKGTPRRADANPDPRPLPPRRRPRRAY